MLVLEHGAGSADSHPGKEDSMDLYALRGGAVLNVLSGLRGGVGLVGGQSEGGWLFEAVFCKTAAQVLDEALEAALHIIGDHRLSKPGDLSSEQANLALRRLLMDSQTKEGNEDEVARVQIWLELARFHFHGLPREATPPTATGSSAPSKEKEKGKAAPERGWHDGEVLCKLGREEAELETESQQMSLEALRAQNRSIEEYVMRLVRQRDELKQVVKLAEERDSYFILGLEGPEATEEQVKKAYRNLARKEHPDKAGIGNKRRFQAIQHAYQNVLRKKQEGADLVVGSPTAASSSKSRQEDREAGKTVASARVEALRARDAAHLVAACAHRTLQTSEDCSDQSHGLPKRRALGALRDATGASAAELQQAAGHLRSLGEAICSLTQLAEDAMAAHQENASGAMAGVGLRDRAAILEDAGRSAASSAELLERISEATEATLQKVAKAAPDGGGGGKRSGEAANLLAIGIKLLGESLSRTAAVARRSADEAIGGATKAIELAGGLAALEREARREQRRKAEKERSFDEDGPVAAHDAEDRSDAGDPGGGKGPSGQSAGDSARGPDSPSNRPPSADSSATPRDKLKSAAARVKERHVALRVKNLRFLANLNEEALKAKAKLSELLERSQGTLLPEVSVQQRNQLFSLVEQIFDFALAETTRLVGNPNAPPNRILERTLGFALALEHGQEIALPTDSRTQALKLALMIDSTLLGQVVDGPFRQRLAALGAKRKAAADSVLGYPAHGRARGSAGAAVVSGVAKSWEDAAHAYCDRISHGVVNALALPQDQAA